MVTASGTHRNAALCLSDQRAGATAHNKARLLGQKSIEAPNANQEALIEAGSLSERAG